MPRKLPASFVLLASLGASILVSTAAIPAAAQKPTDDPTDEQPSDEQSPAALPTAPPPQPPTAQPPQPPATTATDVKEPATVPGPWHIDVNGYFRAPMALGISSRPGPDNPTGPSSTQVSYGPNRTVDANYYSFAYTRLQEQDWAEVFIHARKNHVDAGVGWMGYWLQSAGFRNPDAAWVPGMAYLTLDTDFELAGVQPKVALTMGA